MEERRNSGEIKALELAITEIKAVLAKQSTDMEWVKMSLQRMESKVGCEDCGVSRALDAAIVDRKESIEGLRKDLDQETRNRKEEDRLIRNDLDEHTKASRWTIDRIVLVITAAAVVIWEVAKAFAASGRTPQIP